MRKPVAVALLALSLVGGMSACSSDPKPAEALASTTKPAETPTPTASTTKPAEATSPTSSAPKPAETTPPTSTIPKPDEAQAAALLDALAAIDPGLNEEKSISRSRDQCTSILNEQAGEPHPQYSLVELAQTRFSSTELTEAQAQAVNAAIMAGGWCVKL